MEDKIERIEYLVVLPNDFDENLDYKFIFDNYGETMDFVKTIIERGHTVKLSINTKEE